MRSNMDLMSIKTPRDSPTKRKFKACQDPHHNRIRVLRVKIETLNQLLDRFRGNWHDPRTIETSQRRIEVDYVNPVAPRTGPQYLTRNLSFGRQYLSIYLYCWVLSQNRYCARKRFLQAHFFGFRSHELPPSRIRLRNYSEVLSYLRDFLGLEILKHAICLAQT